jgi:hypothetical protein
MAEQASRLAFSCRMCGCCCLGRGGIVLTRRDQERLRTCLGLSLADFQARYTEQQGGKVSLATTEDNACVFFQTGQGCSIHAYKPDICRAWPFFRGNLLDAMSWKMAQEVCPGINPDVEHKEFINQGLQYLQEKDLVRTPEPQTPTALVVVDLFEGKRG